MITYFGVVLEIRVLTMADPPRTRIFLPVSIGSEICLRLANTIRQRDKLSTLLPPASARYIRSPLRGGCLARGLPRGGGLLVKFYCPVLIPNWVGNG